jgi:hypothetical protein
VPEENLSGKFFWTSSQIFCYTARCQCYKNFYSWSLTLRIISLILLSWQSFASKTTILSIELSLFKFSSYGLTCSTSLGFHGQSIQAFFQSAMNKAKYYNTSSSVQRCQKHSRPSTFSSARVTLFEKTSRVVNRLLSRLVFTLKNINTAFYNSRPPERLLSTIWVLKNKVLRHDLKSCVSVVCFLQK